MFDVSSSDFSRHQRSTCRLASTLLLLLLCTGSIPTSVKAEDEPQAISHENEAADDISHGQSVADEFRVEVIESAPECVRTSQNGNLLKVLYTGYLTDGTTFDASEGDSPFAFVLGLRRVIEGFDLGLVDMCVGETRRLIIPPHLAFGNEVKTINGQEIAPSSTLIYDVKLVDFLEVDPSEEWLNFENLDYDKDGLLSRDEIKDYLWKLSVSADDIADAMATRQGQEFLVDNLLQNYDLNGDGLLSLEEFQTPIHGPRDEL